MNLSIGGRKEHITWVLIAEQGLFVDQLWFNLVPILFKGVKISTNKGLIWLHGICMSALSFKDGEFIISNNIPLIFIILVDINI